MSDRGKLLRKPWGMKDILKEKKIAEKRKQIVEKWREKWRKQKEN